MLGSSICAVNETQTRKLPFYDAELLKAEPRPKSKLASYLSPSRTAEQNDGPLFDWSILGEKDEVHGPAPELLSNTILQHLLNYPMGDLPAQYSDFVLRMVEDYRRLAKDNERLSQQLRAEVESHVEDSEQLRQVVELYLRGREATSREIVQAGGADLRLENFQKGGIARASRPLGHASSPLVESSRAKKATEDSMRRRYTSPSRSMALITRAVLAADEKMETILTSSEQSSKHDYVSSIEETPLKLQNEYDNHDLSSGHSEHLRTAFISRLTERLIRRIHCELHQIYQEIFDTCNEIRDEDFVEVPSS